MVNCCMRACDTVILTKTHNYQRQREIAAFEAYSDYQWGCCK